jgi:2-polyprenyl-3-methyl-5-hydroxy-6-metoxy-1,4-benzoquinol methylase
MNPWNERYAGGELPWDTGRPCSHLVEAVGAAVLPRGRILEIGCGTGTNAVWLAEQGFTVTGVDIAPLALERARARAAAAGVTIAFRAFDILGDEALQGPFEAVFDRGCFHVFDAATDRERFASRVAQLLVPGGRWLSMIGSTEGAPRETGPPRRSARDIALAVEPHLEIISLATGVFDLDREDAARAWCCVSARRTLPAQPSTQRG